MRAGIGAGHPIRAVAQTAALALRGSRFSRRCWSALSLDRPTGILRARASAAGRLVAREKYFRGGVVKSVGESLKGCMASVCRTAGCAGVELDELGYCAVCRGRYERHRREVDALGERYRRAHWPLFAGLGEELAARLAAHVTGRAQIGGGVGAALCDMLAEAREVAVNRRIETLAPGFAGGAFARPRLRVYQGGGER